MMRAGKRYLAVKPLPIFDSEERVPTGVKLTVVSPDEVATDAGTVHRLMQLQVNRPEWFMQETDVFNPPPATKPTRAELTFEVVRAYPDLLMHELWERVTACDPTGLKPIKIDSFSSLLSKDTRIEMFKDGVKVNKLEHNARYCTFRPRGWEPAK